MMVGNERTQIFVLHTEYCIPFQNHKSSGHTYILTNRAIMYQGYTFVLLRSNIMIRITLLKKIIY